MEAAYGIGVQNRYALFLEEESTDPFALLNNAAAASTTSNHHNQNEPSSVKKGAAGGSHSLNKLNQQQLKSGAGSVSSASKSPNQTATATNNNQSNQKSSALSESKQNVMANQKSDGGRPNRGPRSGQQRGGPAGGNRENQENRVQRSPRNPESNEAGDFKNSKELRGDKADNRRNGFARGPGTGGRSGGNDRGGRFHKREFNRHSGSDRSGIKSTEKREGGGSHNWGKIDDFNEQTDLDLTNDGEKPANENEKTLEEGAEGANASGPDNEQTETEPKNDEPQLKTLDEYKREMEEKRMHTQFNIRKPGEGEDKSKWKKTYVLKKKPVTEEEEVEYEEIEVEEDTNKRRNRQILDIEVDFRPAEGGREVFRRGRGGPGRPGGRRNDQGRSGGPGGNAPAGGSGPQRGGPHGGGRGGGRGRDRNRSQPAPKFDDPNDFPSLSGQK